MAFPSSPTNGQQVTVNNTVYQYNTAKSAWVRVNPILTSLEVTGNATIGNVISSGFFWSNGAPFASSNYGNTQVAAYLTGNVTVGNVAATGYYFANGAPFASSNYSNSNVAAYLPTYTGNVSAGNVISSAYYFSNGSPFSITQLTSTVNAFTGNGVQTDFTLTVTPASKDYTFAAIGGVMQPRTAYSVTGTTISFSSAPPNGSPVEITTIGGSAASPTADSFHPFLLMGA